jgi:hypothetical protein
MSLRLGRIPWINDISDRIRTWSVRSLYRADSLVTVSKEPSKYKLDLVGVQEVRWEGGGTKPGRENTFFYAKRNENRELGTGCCV